MARGEARAGTAYVNSADSRAAASSAAREALTRAGGGDPTLVICFHHGRHDADAIRAGIEDVIGFETPIVGGTAMGVMTNDALGYEGHQVGVAVITGAEEGISVSSADGLRSLGEHSVGRALGESVADKSRDLFLLYSSVRTGVTDPGGLALFFGTPLLAGLKESGNEPRALAGAGLIDSLQLRSSHVFAPEGVLRDGAVALAIGDNLRMDSIVLHGCLPAGAYHEITNTEGALVLEIDGRPALEVIDELMGASDHENYPFRVILGVNRGDRFGPYDAETYQTRLCLAVVPERGALAMFEPDLEAGASVQLMRVSRDLNYIADSVKALQGRLQGRRPVLALYADCAGRCMAASPLESEEGDVVRAALGEIPLLGFYTGVEIGQVGSDAHPLDWTGVLCIISE